MTKTIERMIRRFFSYDLKFKYLDGFTHYLCTLIPALEITHKTGIHSSKGQTPAILEKACNSRLPEEILRKGLIEIYPTDSSLDFILDKEKQHEKSSMDDTFEYKEQNFENIHAVPDFKLGDIFPVSTPNFNYIQGLKKLGDSYV
ncbi:hypothetical protein O181_026393 [Austropuccinia psidii MF-1]|uniref:Uncharacterized protein n=1 Tax=Austropuccinia psidii MF-1 TaxID=1389203 RepID=A0A9Q3CMH4_9BASI|nr:hypothetical protein [Austropuccinia psidii MF-1]